MGGFYNSLHTKKPIELVSESFTNLNNWSVVGANEYSANNKLTITSGANVTNHTKYISLNNYKCNFKSQQVQFRFAVKDISLTSNGFGVGWKGSYSSCLDIDTKSGVINAYFAGFGGAFNFRAALVGTNLACSLNNVVYVEYSLKLNRASCTITNITKGTTTTYASLYNIYVGTDWPNTHTMAIYSNGGTHEISDLKITSGFKEETEIVFIGDSITCAGLASIGTNGNEVDSYTYKVGINFNDYAVCAGNGDKTAEVLECLPKILLLKPKKAVLLIGTNDFGGAVSTSTFSANLTSIYNQLVAIGTDVYVCKILPRNNAGIDAYNTVITNVIPSGKVIDTYTALKGTGIGLKPEFESTDNDGLHPGGAGHTAIANAIKTKLGIP